MKGSFTELQVWEADSGTKLGSYLSGQGPGPVAPLQVMVEFPLEEMDIPLGTLLQFRADRCSLLLDLTTLHSLWSDGRHWECRVVGGCWEGGAAPP